MHEQSSSQRSDAARNACQPGSAGVSPACLQRSTTITPARRRRSQVGTLATCLILLSFSGEPLVAQTFIPRNKSTVSLSGQFTCQDLRPRGSSELAAFLSASNQFISLDPTLVTVSCERIKKHLMDQLGATASFQGRVFLTVRPAENPDDPIVVTSERFPGSWRYRVDLPDVTERARYVRAIVQVLLLEMANRSTPPRSAELPLWLVEGLTRQLLASSELEIVLPPPNQKANGLAFTSAYFESRRQNPQNSQRDDPLAIARNVLRSNPMMTFDQLSWPLEDQLAGDQKELFCCTAQVFVSELLKTKEGQASMLSMLGQLPNYYNWQFAFLAAYKQSFGRLLDVEKWWTLRWVSFTGTEGTLTWRLEESWEKLDQCLRMSAEVRTNANQVPIHSDATLQTVIRQWPEEQQKTELHHRIEQLELLRFKADPQMMPFLDDYRRVLERFLKESHPSVVNVVLRKQAAIKSAQEEACKELDLLDARRLVAASPGALARAKSAPTAK